MQKARKRKPLPPRAGEGGDGGKNSAMKVPNAETRAAMAEAEEMTRSGRFAMAAELFDDLGKKRG